MFKLEISTDNVDDISAISYLSEIIMHGDSSKVYVHSLNEPILTLCLRLIAILEKNHNELKGEIANWQGLIDALNDVANVLENVCANVAS